MQKPDNELQPGNNCSPTTGEGLEGHNYVRITYQFPGNKIKESRFSKRPKAEDADAQQSDYSVANPDFTPMQTELAEEYGIVVPTISYSDKLKHRLARSGLRLGIDHHQLWEGSVESGLEVPIGAHVEPLSDEDLQETRWPRVWQSSEHFDPVVSIAYDPSDAEIRSQRKEMNVTLWAGILAANEIFKDGGESVQREYYKRVKNYRRGASVAELALITASIISPELEALIYPGLIIAFGNIFSGAANFISDDEVVRYIQKNKVNKARQLAANYKVLDYEYIEETQPRRLKTSS
jgi:hypothetical protein